MQAEGVSRSKGKKLVLGWEEKEEECERQDKAALYRSLALFALPRSSRIVPGPMPQSSGGSEPDKVLGPSELDVATTRGPRSAAKRVACCIIVPMTRSQIGGRQAIAFFRAEASTKILRRPS